MRKARYTLQTLARGLAVLEGLAAADRDLTLTELAAHLEVSRTVAFRLLRTLLARGWVQQDPTTKRYRLALRAWEVGVRAVRRTGLVEVAHPVLRWLAQVTGETAVLAVLRDTDVLYLDVVHSPSPLRVCLEPGAWAPAHATATGKVLLAHHPEAATQVVQRGLRAITPRTVTRPARLRAVLEEVRRTGVAVNRGEHRVDIASVAAAVFDEHSTCVAAVGLAGPATRFTEDHLAELVRRVRKAAREITARLTGWEPTPVARTLREGTHGAPSS
jgi:DNA-binding IclR family transcriptional regulator